MKTFDLNPDGKTRRSRVRRNEVGRNSKGRNRASRVSAVCWPFVFLSFLFVTFALSSTACVSSPKEPGIASSPLVLAHRGASGYRPEHTLQAYELAISMGADFIEPDLVSTKDGILIARHENEISETTDVAKKFPQRKTKKNIDGRSVEGFFTEDFTLAEIKSLRAKERLPARKQTYNGEYEIPTFQQVIDLALQKSVVLKRPIGIYPEAKHPTYFASIKLSLEERIVATLKQNGLSSRTAPVFIQSFEPSSLRRFKTLTEAKLIQLIDAQGAPYDFALRNDKRTYADLTTNQGLAEIATYAQGIGANKRLIVPVNASGNLDKPTDLVKRAHDQNLLVHAWTFRNEDAFLAKEYEKQPIKEYLQFFELGIDGVFSDFSDYAFAARKLFESP